MSRALPRTNLHSSTFIRCLADLALVDGVEAGTAFAEKLGQWIHFADAITLSSVHGDGSAGLPAKQPGTRVATGAAAAIEAEFARIHAVLVNSVRKSFSPGLGKTHLPLPEPEFALPVASTAGTVSTAAFAPYRRFYEAHQRDMELGIQPLRVNVREALAKASPRLKKLALLDATLEKILRERESKLLGKVPALLKKRFEQLLQAHQEQLAAAQQADNPAGWSQAGGWLACFCKDMQTLLLAEAELRLQPTIGLIEAFKQDTQ